jgi:hypothetical protein
MMVGKGRLSLLGSLYRGPLVVRIHRKHLYQVV